MAPTIEINAINAGEVPTALCILNFNMSAIAGTAIIPPPMPSNPDKNPINTPIKI